MNTQSLSIILALLLAVACNSPQTTSQAQVKPEASELASGIDSLETQQFDVPTDTETLISGIQGTMLMIPRNAFVDEAGKPVTGTVDVRLIEANTMESLVTGRISTLSDGRVLATGGTFCLEATADGKPVRINPETGLYAALPSFGKDPDMRLFTGNPVDGDINWSLAEDSVQQAFPEPKRPPVQRPEGLEVVQELLDIQQVRSILRSIDDGELVQKGTKWVPVDGQLGRMSWEDGFIQKCRDWLAYQGAKEKQLLALDKKVQARNEKRKEAWAKYLATLQQYESEMAVVKEQIQQEQTFFEFRLSKLGWVNCDKFVRREMATYAGTLLMPDGKPSPYARVHLVSRKERIHLTAMADINGNYSFLYPKNLPFTVLAFRGEQRGHKTFPGNTATLEPVTLAMR